MEMGVGKDGMIGLSLVSVVVHQERGLCFRGEELGLWRGRIWIGWTVEGKGSDRDCWLMGEASEMESD